MQYQMTLNGFFRYPYLTNPTSSSLIQSFDTFFAANELVSVISCFKVKLVFPMKKNVYLGQNFVIFTFFCLFEYEFDHFNCLDNF